MTNWAITPEEIRAVRCYYRLSQKQAAVLAGLSSRHRWAEYENGTRKPTSFRWRAFLRAAEDWDANGRGPVSSPEEDAPAKA